MKIIPPQSGVSLTLKKGDRLKVIDLEGEQVADLFCFAQQDPADALSSGRSIDYGDTFLFRKGHELFSQAGRPMLRLVEDTCGRHDFLVTPCSQQMFEMLGVKGYHPSCLENLENSFRDFPVNTAQIGTTFNIFMNIPFTETGKIKVAPPASRAGDFVVLEALMDLYVGLTACSDEGTNNGRCKPIGYLIFEHQHGEAAQA